jgi:hypothetical protein
MQIRRDALGPRAAAAFGATGPSVGGALLAFTRAEMADRELRSTGTVAAIGEWA